MRKIQIYWPSFLYKRPISKTSSLFQSILPKSNTNKSAININTNEEEPYINNYMTETNRTEINKNKFKYIYSNFGNFKKQTNNYNNRYSTNYMKIKNKKKNFDIKESNSSFFQNKDIESKIFPNYNNTCNISLNQHFYNIVDKNYSLSNSSIKKNDIEGKYENNKKNEIYGYIPKFKNIYNQVNKSTRNKKYNIFLNSFNKKYPMNIIKDVNKSYNSNDNNINSFFYNNLISRMNKKNIINLIVNSSEQNYNINKTTNLENYVNFRMRTSDRKKKDKINLTDNIIGNNYNKNNINNDNNFKYTKKIISSNNLNKKNDNKLNQKSLKNSIPFANYKDHIFPFNKYHELINTNNRSMYVKENKNNIYHSCIMKKIEPINSQRNANSTRTKKINDKNKDTPNFHSFLHLSNLYNNKKMISVGLNPKFKYKKFENKNSLEKNKISFSNAKLLSHNFDNNFSKKTKINKNINIINSTFNKNNHSSLKLNNISNVIYSNNNTFLKLKNEISRENNNKSNLIKVEDYKLKKIKDFPNNNPKLKKINLNKILNTRKISPKFSVKSSRGNKEIANLKKMFIEHFVTEGNKNINNNNTNNSSTNIKINLNSNNKKTQAFNFKSNKKVINNENKTNNKLKDLLDKFRQSKNLNEKNNNLNKNKLIKGNMLNKKTNNIVDNSNNQTKIKINLKKNKLLPKINLNKSPQKTEPNIKNIKNKENNKYM